jgi:spore maturation protein CgeB
VTRRAMARNGYCPSGRLFEAAACGTPVISDDWPGLGEFFEPDAEIIVARTADDVIDAMQMSDSQLHRIAADARDRVLAEHTSAHRAIELERMLDEVRPAQLEATDP